MKKLGIIFKVALLSALAIALGIIIFAVSSFLGKIDLTSENKLFEEMLDEREKFAEAVLKGEYVPDERGIIDLPKDKMKLSDGGWVSVVKINGKCGIYFMAYNGILGSSHGYIYTFDIGEGRLLKINTSWNFVNDKIISEKWLSISTE